MPPENALPLVLIPGFMLDETLWDEVVESLPATCEVHRANLLEGQTLAQIARHVVASAPPRFVLVGFSLGGYVARSIVQQCPDRVAALILIATSLREDSPERQKAKQAAVDASAHGQFRGLSLAAIRQSVHPQRAADNAVTGRIREMGARMGHAVFATQSLLTRADVGPHQIQCPTLVIAAAQDALRQVEEAEALCGQIPGARLEIIQGSGHMIPLEQPQVLAQLMMQWLAAMPQASPLL
jgi:Predicted hydrolases or acyltransferases (alpha/beta hydrolase superfamily)